MLYNSVEVKLLGVQSSKPVMSIGSMETCSSQVGSLWGRVIRHESMSRVHVCSFSGNLKDCVP